MTRDGPVGAHRLRRCDAVRRRCGAWIVRVEDSRHRRQIGAAGPVSACSMPWRDGARYRASDRVEVGDPGAAPTAIGVDGRRCCVRSTSDGPAASERQRKVGLPRARSDHRQPRSHGMSSVQLGSIERRPPVDATLADQRPHPRRCPVAGSPVDELDRSASSATVTRTLGDRSSMPLVAAQTDPSRRRRRASAAIVVTRMPSTVTAARARVPARVAPARSVRRADGQCDARSRPARVRLSPSARRPRASPAIAPRSEASSAILHWRRHVPRLGTQRVRPLVATAHRSASRQPALRRTARGADGATPAGG